MRNGRHGGQQQPFLLVLGRRGLELGVLDSVLRHRAGADHPVVQLPAVPAAGAET